ncbi:hypothetical protein [Moraxella sp. K2450]|uniref:hypothetical protein n=1 Tax=Moraxella sp. K2450 TaxID=2780076 RepID=UPI001882C6F6|nr:hypothetical protein [Moraxella sp. K2450]MBE9597168.1 hypothetical protein [Moraxella sp. K2450]
MFPFARVVGERYLLPRLPPNAQGKQACRLSFYSWWCDQLTQSDCFTLWCILLLV